MTTLNEIATLPPADRAAIALESNRVEREKIEAEKAAA